MRSRMFEINIEDNEVDRDSGVDIDVMFWHHPAGDLDPVQLEDEENIAIAVEEVINALAYFWPVYVQKVLGPSIQFHVEQALDHLRGDRVIGTRPVIETTEAEEPAP